MRNISILFFIICTCCRIQAQMVQPNPTVFIYVGDKAFPMNSVTSQVEIKQGWEIQGVKVNKKPIRYFWGAHARQVTDSQPRFAIYPTTQKLNDYVLVRLKEKKQYRRLEAADIKDCKYIRVDLEGFRIDNLPEMGFMITPLTPLTPGEYILTDLTQPTVNRYGDFKAYDFKVEKEERK